jgi:quercetin dioxygenase-like cupin family protein
MSTASTERRCEHGDRVAIYALGALPKNVASQMKAHLPGCKDCQHELEQLLPVVNWMIDWPIDDIKPAAATLKAVEKRISSEVGREVVLRTGRAIGDRDWKQVSPGIWCKLLAMDEEHERVSMLVRLAPGVVYPPHTHAGVEELHLLDGELWIDDRLLFAGEFNRAEPGSSDRFVWSATGCTCVLVTSPKDVLG